jgi:hypothetical protein
MENISDYSCELGSSLHLFHNLDLFFSQPVKLVDQGVYLAIGGLDHQIYLIGHSGMALSISPIRRMVSFKATTIF